MKKLLMVTTAVLMSMVPVMQAQESDEAPNPDAQGSGAPAAQTADKTGKDAKAAANNPFAGQQKKIDDLMKKMKNAKKVSERRRLRDSLNREQRNYEILVNRKLRPLEDKVNPLREQIRLSPKSSRAQREKELAELEAKIDQLKKAADLEKWCSKVENNSSDNAPNPGSSGKKIRRGKKKK